MLQASWALGLNLKTILHLKKINFNLIDSSLRVMQERYAKLKMSI